MDIYIYLDFIRDLACAVFLDLFSIMKTPANHPTTKHTKYTEHTNRFSSALYADDCRLSIRTIESHIIQPPPHNRTMRCIVTVARQ